MARFRPPSPLSLLPSGFFRLAFGKLGSVWRSEFALDGFRLVVPEVLSALEAPALEPTLPWRWWELLPTSCTPAERTSVHGTSLSRKLSPARDYAAGLECGIDPVSESGREFGGQVIDPARTYPTRCSSVVIGKNGSSLALSRCFRVLHLFPALRLSADCARPPLLPLLRTGFRTGIRVEPSRAHAGEFRRAEAASGYPQTDHSSTVNISRGWEWSSGRRWGLRTL